MTWAEGEPQTCSDEKHLTACRSLLFSMQGGAVGICQRRRAGQSLFIWGGSQALKSRCIRTVRCEGTCSVPHQVRCRLSDFWCRHQAGLCLTSLHGCNCSPNCISTSEEANQRDNHYVPPLTYNPIPGRGRKNPASREKAMEELVSVVSSLTASCLAAATCNVLQGHRTGCCRSVHSSQTGLSPRSSSRIQTTSMWSTRWGLHSSLPSCDSMLHLVHPER